MECQKLVEAAQNGDIAALYSLIAENPYILRNIDDIPFFDTPLHVAAFSGKAHFALETMRMMPSFSRKPNRDGHTPLHLALQNQQTQLAIRLAQVDPDLVRVKGREGVTPLHLAAKEGLVHPLISFLSACPESLEDLTIRSETALHVALKNGRVEAFKALLGWVRLGCSSGEIPDLEEKVLNWKDDEGNTLLQIATSTAGLEVARRLLIESNVVVTKPSPAPDISTLANRLVSDKNALSERIFAYIKKKGELYHPRRDVVAVVAVLVATAAYQAGLNPPGGVWQEDYIPTRTADGSKRPLHQAGTAVMGIYYYLLFQAFNATAFFASMGLIFVLCPVGPYVLLLEYSLVASYLLSVAFVAPNSIECNLFNAILAVVSFVIVWYLSLLRYRRSRGTSLYYYVEVVLPSAVEVWRRRRGHTALTMDWRRKGPFRSLPVKLAIVAVVVAIVVIAIVSLFFPQLGNSILGGRVPENGGG